MAMPDGGGYSPPATKAAPLSKSQLDGLARDFAKTRLAQRAQSSPAKAPSVFAARPNGQNFASLPITTDLGGRRTVSDPKRGVVFVEAGGSNRSLAAAKSGEKLSSAAVRFLEDNPALFRLAAPAKELVEVREQFDDLGMTHIVFQQTRHGLPFWGRELRAHFDKSGQLQSVNGFVVPSPSEKEGPETPVLSEAEAIEALEARLERDGADFFLTDHAADLLGYTGPVARLQYWQHSAGAPVELVYVVETRPNMIDWYRGFIRASDGKVLEYYNATASGGAGTVQGQNLLGETVTLQIFEDNGTQFLVDTSRPMFPGNLTPQQILNEGTGTITTLDLRGKDLTQDAQIFHVTAQNGNFDRTGISAHDYGARAFEYFRQTHNRNSLNGTGGAVFSIIHVTQNGQPMDNAFWNGAAMFYGDGNRAFEPLARSLDVAVHEMSHGVIQFTANLEYRFQSGALNESFADVFGVIVDEDDFRLGEDVVKLSAFPSGALRDIENPNQGGTGLNSPGWQPKDMSQFLDLTIDQDNGGVHINSGIPNHVAYKVMVALGRQKTGAIWYRALATYLGKNSNFVECRAACERAARDLFGDGSPEVQAVSKAFGDVGIGGGTGGGGNPTPTPTPTPEPAPVPAGDQLWMFTQISDGFPFIGRLDDAEGSIFGFGERPVNFESGRPIAVSPFGDEMFIVGADGSLYGYVIDASPRVLDAVQISPSGWNSVSISPTGRRVSLTRSGGSNEMVVLDLVDQQTSVIPLLHPTTSQDGQLLDIVQQADTMAWLDDQFVAFDAFKVLPGPNGTNQNFWDITILDVETGRFFPLLPPQEQGILIGNPTLSTRDNRIMIFDVLNTPIQDSGIFGIDFSSGRVVGLLTGLAGILSKPDYSSDDSVILFSGPDSQSNSGTSVYWMDMNDRLTPAGSDRIFLVIPDFEYGLWWTFGRVIPQLEGVVNYLNGSPATGIMDVNSDSVEDSGDVIEVLRMQ